MYYIFIVPSEVDVSLQKVQAVLERLAHRASAAALSPSCATWSDKLRIQTKPVVWQLRKDKATGPLQRVRPVSVSRKLNAATVDTVGACSPSGTKPELARLDDGNQCGSISVDQSWLPAWPTAPTPLATQVHGARSSRL